MRSRKEVLSALSDIGTAQLEFHRVAKRYEAERDRALLPLVLEGARLRLSAKRMAAYAGVTQGRIKSILRRTGIDGRNISMVAEQTEKVLEHNAALLDVDITQIDLMSPLAYIPAGPGLRREGSE